MGWWKKLKDKVKKVFKKVTKVVKKVVKKIGGAAKKVWNGVKKVAKKAGAFLTKLGPVANIAMNFIPGFGQLWQAYGIWGSMAKGAITGYLTSGGNVKGALLGAAGAAAGDWYSKLEGTGVTEKFSKLFDLDGSSGKLGKSFTDYFNPKTGINGYQGRIGVDTTNLPPSMRGQYEYSAPSLDSIQGSYQANWGKINPATNAAYTHKELLAKMNAQAFSDDAFNAAAGNYRKPKQPSTEDLSNLMKSPFSEDTEGPVGFAANTSPLTSYNTQAGYNSGQVGTGQDSNEKLVQSLGLSLLRSQVGDAEQRRKRDEQILMA